MNLNKFQKIILASFVGLLVFPFFALAQTKVMNMPQNTNDIKQLGENALETTKSQGPGIISDIWQNDVLPIWEKMYSWAKVEIWDNWLKDWLLNIWHSVLRVLKVEVNQRKSGVENRLQTQTQEAAQEAPQLGKSLWQKFMDAIK